MTFSESLDFVVKIASPFRAVCSLFSNSSLFGALCCLCQSFRAVCSSCSSSLVSFERFGPCSQIPQSVSSHLLLVLKYSSPFRLVCSLFSNSLSLSSGLVLVLSWAWRPCDRLLSRACCPSEAPGSVGFGRLPLHSHVVSFLSAFPPALPCPPLPSPNSPFLSH